MNVNNDYINARIKLIKEYYVPLCINLYIYIGITEADTY